MGNRLPKGPINRINLETKLAAMTVATAAAGIAAAALSNQIEHHSVPTAATAEMGILDTAATTALLYGNRRLAGIRMDRSVDQYGKDHDLDASATLSSQLGHNGMKLLLNDMCVSAASVAFGADNAYALKHPVAFITTIPLAIIAANLADKRNNLETNAMAHEAQSRINDLQSTHEYAEATPLFEQAARRLATDLSAESLMHHQPDTTTFEGVYTTPKGDQIHGQIYCKREGDQLSYVSMTIEDAAYGYPYGSPPESPQRQIELRWDPETGVVRDSDQSPVTVHLFGLGLIIPRKLSHDKQIAFLNEFLTATYDSEATEAMLRKRSHVPYAFIHMPHGQLALPAVDQLTSPTAEGTPDDTLDATDTILNALKEIPDDEAYTERVRVTRYLRNIEKKMNDDPDVVLTHDEVRFLYEIDDTIQAIAYERPQIDELQAMRGDRDHQELASIIPETIRSQARTAVEAYTTVARQLGAEQLDIDEFNRLFALKDAEWRANGAYDHAINEFERRRSCYTLVATPNITVGENEVIELAQMFAREEQRRLHINEGMYRQTRHLSSRYTPEEWSGRSSDTAIKFSLIPSKYDTALSNQGAAKATEQLEILRTMQAQAPNLHYHVPSLIETITYWFMLRAQGHDFNKPDLYDKTNIRHFDMEPQSVGGFLEIPNSYSGGDSEHLDASDADPDHHLPDNNAYAGRIALG